MVCKKIIVSMLFVFTCTHAMDSDVFSRYMVVLSNELTAQERQEEQGKIKKYVQEKKKKEKELKKLIKVSIGLFGTIFFICHCMKR